MFKIAFFDIDWTIYDHKNHRWDEESLDAIKELKRRGVKCFLCTARNYDSIKDFGALDIGIEWDGFIANSGAIGVVEGKTIFEQYMEPKTAYEAVAFLKEIGVCGEIPYDNERKLLAPLTEEAKHYYSYYVEKIPPIEEYKGRPSIGITVFASEEKDHLFKERFPELIIFRYFKYAFDWVPAMHYKGNPVEKILEHYGFKKEESVGFGDNFQDISLLEKVGTFYAMGNSDELLLKAAKNKTDAVWDSGVAKAIKNWF